MSAGRRSRIRVRSCWRSSHCPGHGRNTEILCQLSLAQEPPNVRIEEDTPAAEDEEVERLQLAENLTSAQLAGCHCVLHTVPAAGVLRIPAEHGKLGRDAATQLAQDLAQDGLVSEVHPAVRARYSDAIPPLLSVVHRLPQSSSPRLQRVTSVLEMNRARQRARRPS